MSTHEYAIRVERSNDLYKVSVPALDLSAYVTRIGVSGLVAAERIANHLGISTTDVVIASIEYVDIAASDIVESRDSMPEGLRGHLA